MDDDSGRAGVVDEVASFVHGEEIEPGIGAGSPSNCAKIGNEYGVRARKAIQDYFGPDFHVVPPGRRHPPERPQDGGRRA